MQRYIDIHPKIQQAIKNNKPVVALESTIISHGMPFPKNMETPISKSHFLQNTNNRNKNKKQPCVLFGESHALVVCIGLRELLLKCDCL